MKSLQGSNIGTFNPNYIYDRICEGKYPKKTIELAKQWGFYPNTIAAIEQRIKNYKRWGYLEHAEELEKLLKEVIYN